MKNDRYSSWVGEKISHLRFPNKQRYMQAGSYHAAYLTAANGKCYPYNKQAKKREQESCWTSCAFQNRIRSCQMPVYTVITSMLIFLVIGMIIGIRMGRQRSQ